MDAERGGNVLDLRNETDEMSLVRLAHFYYTSFKIATSKSISGVMTTVPKYLQIVYLLLLVARTFN